LISPSRRSLSTSLSAIVLLDDVLRVGTTVHNRARHQAWLKRAIRITIGIGTPKIKSRIERISASLKS
jgi:hypothetical protein